MKPPETSADLRELIDANRRLFHQLAAAAEAVHRDLGMTAGERAVLIDLEENGPQTVPSMARKRPVSRQHIQTLVNRLLDRRLVELRDNPRHRRSSLVATTDSGHRTAVEILGRERALLAELPLGASGDQVRTATRTLVALGQALGDAGLV